MRSPSRFVFALAAGFVASGALAVPALAASKDSVTIGMTLEPPGLDPTTAAAAAIGEITHYNIFEGLTKINEDFSITPLLAEKWSFSPDLKTLTFNLAQGRQVPGRRGVFLQGRQILVRARRGQGLDQQGKGVLRLDRIDRRQRSRRRHAEVQGAELPGLVSPRPEHRGHLDEKSAATEATKPVGTGPYKLAAWNKGSSVTLDKWDGFRDAGKIAIAHATFLFISDPSAEVAAMLAGDIDAFPRIAAFQNVAQFQSDPRFQVLIGGTEGKTILGINNKKKPLDDLRVRQAIAYAIDRKAIIDGAHERLRHADRQPPDARTIPAMSI